MRFITFITFHKPLTVVFYWPEKELLAFWLGALHFLLKFKESPNWLNALLMSCIALRYHDFSVLRYLSVFCSLLLPLLWVSKLISHLNRSLLPVLQLMTFIVKYVSSPLRIYPIKFQQLKTF